jgi:hypothetical protein
VKTSRVVLVFWLAVVVGLVVLELAELTHFFTPPVQLVLGDPVTLVFSLLFTTIVAVIGAIFIGIYISHRILSPAGFTPFEEEMLRMRTEIREMRMMLEGVRQSLPPVPAEEEPPPPRERTL